MHLIETPCSPVNEAAINVYISFFINVIKLVRVESELQ